MANQLEQALNGLTATLVASIINSIQASSLADVARDAPAGRGAVAAPARPRSPAPRRLTKAPRARETARRATGAKPSARAQPRSTAKDAALIVAYLRSHGGTTGEAARKALGLEKNRWNTCVYRGLREGKIRKRGDRRMTKYWAA